MERRYVRICWNTSGWKRPTGDARPLESDSYVSANGFGHEEWLFNFDWVLPPYRNSEPGLYKYGYTQPLGKFYHSYRGKYFDILLYTFPPGGVPYFAARIRRVFIPHQAEIEWARKQFVDNGWFEIMKRQLRGPGCDPSLLDDPIPFHVLNMRFKQNDLDIYDPMIPVPLDHKIRRMFRYHPMIWDDTFEPR